MEVDLEDLAAHTLPDPAVLAEADKGTAASLESDRARQVLAAVAEVCLVDSRRRRDRFVRSISTLLDHRWRSSP